MVVSPLKGCYVVSKRGPDGIGLSEEIGIPHQESTLEGQDRRDDE